MSKIQISTALARNRSPSEAYITLNEKQCKAMADQLTTVSQRPRPSGRGLKKGNNSLAASIPTLPGGALKGGGKLRLMDLEGRLSILDMRKVEQAVRVQLGLSI